MAVVSIWPGIVKTVAGALPYTRYGWLKRWLLRRIVRQHGGDTDWTRDFEYTDWDDLRAFAHSFNEMIQGLAERERVKKVFGRYVTTQVAERVLGGGRIVQGVISGRGVRCGYKRDPESSRKKKGSVSVAAGTIV